MINDNARKNHPNRPKIRIVQGLKMYSTKPTTTYLCLKNSLLGSDALLLLFPHFVEEFFSLPH